MDDLEVRWFEIASELARRTANRPPQEPATGHEAELLAEQDRIEWEIGDGEWISTPENRRSAAGTRPMP